ncbi:hypothetical protein ACHWQZ_G014876 [Mnemiopsis leidyi]
MNHQTLNQNLTCYSAVLIAVKTIASRSYLMDTIEGRFTVGGSDFSVIMEKLPTFMEGNLSYSVVHGSVVSGWGGMPWIKSSELDTSGNFKIKGMSVHRYPDKVKLLYIGGASAIIDFNVNFEVTVSDDCKEKKIACDGEPDCADFSDEMRCSAKGVYSRMALSDRQELFIPTDPSKNHTLCFYTFGGLIARPSFIDGTGTEGLNITSKGFYCTTYNYKNLVYQTYIYDALTKEFTKHKESVTSRKDVSGWDITATSNVKNVIVYNKILDREGEMRSYLSQCGKEGYPSPSDLDMDHHFLVTYQRQLMLSEGDNSTIKYVVLPSMCEEKATPTGSVDLVTTYLCDSGETISYHCEGEQSCTDDREKECEYYNSEIVALFKNPTEASCSKAKVKNEFNNRLAAKAITSANTFIANCSTSTCTESAYLQDLRAGTTDEWATEGESGINYSNWSSVITAPSKDTPVRLNKDGSWDLGKSAGGSLVCNVGSGGFAGKALKFTSNTDYSQLKIEKASILNKLTLCWAASGSGVLLHYTGTTSITGKDIYIATEKTTERTYLTVYIAGFPEYFDLDNSLITSYICLRWEKVTGRIDLAISGELIAGKNSYANSRKINLPSTGKLIVGAAMTADKPYTVTPSTGRWTGQINNLVIYNQFYSPLMMMETSKTEICDERRKTVAWLTFEDVIAGSSNHEMYASFKENVELCGNSGKYRKKRQEDGTRDGDADKTVISINYAAYTSNSDEVSKWALSTESGISVEIVKGDYSVRELSNTGNIKINPLKKLCITGSGTLLDDKFGYHVEIAAYSTGMTSFEIGQRSITIEAGNPGRKIAEKVYPTGGQICVTNVLSPSDYAPLDGFIQTISLWRDIEATLACVSETEDIGVGGVLEWPATELPGEVTATCPYGNKDNYEKIGLATRTCGESGWSGSSKNDMCAGKYTISVDEAKEYFENTKIDDENVDEYANTINQVVQESEVVTKETVNTAADALDQMSKATDVKITDTTMDTVVEVANTINLKSETKDETKEEEAKTAKKIVESVASLAAKVELEENVPFISKTESVSVAAFKPPPRSVPAQGGDDKASGDITATFEKEEDGTNIDVKTTSDQETDVKEKTNVIKIKRDQVGPQKTVWFTSYRGNSTLFNSDSTFELDGQIVGAGIGEGRTDFEPGKRVLMTFYTENKVDNINALCQFWDMSSGVGVWSSEGMTFISKTENSIDCMSDHLTNFAILINPSNTYFTGAEELTLQIITIAGCTLSIIGLLATIIGLAVFKQIRSVLTNRVHIGLSTSLLFAYIFLLIGPDLVEDEGVCYFFSILTHFCFLSAFCWMLCEAVNLYLRLVVVFESYSRMFLKFSIFSSVTPLVIVLITTIVEFAGEKGAYIVEDRASGVRVVCWLDHKARMAAFLLPLLLILCANFVVFIMVMRVLFGNKKSATASNKTHWLARLRSAVAVSTLIGLSWILGFFALGEASFGINIIFALCNSLQGVLICYLYCFAKTDVMTKWRSTIQSSLGRSTRGKDQSRSLVIKQRSQLTGQDKLTLPKSEKDQDTSGLSSSNSGAPRPHARFNAAKSNTQSTSVALSSKGPSTAVPAGDKNGKFNNVYSNKLAKC